MLAQSYSPSLTHAAAADAAAEESFFRTALDITELCSGQRSPWCSSTCRRLLQQLAVAMLLQGGLQVKQQQLSPPLCAGGDCLSITVLTGSATLIPSAQRR